MQDGIKSFEQESSTALSKLVVDRVSSLSPAEVNREYCAKNRPVIITDAAKDWAVMKMLTPDYLKQHFGWKALSTRAGWMSLKTVLEKLEASDPNDPAPYPTLMLLEEEFPELIPMAQPLPLPHSLPNRLVDSRLQGKRFGSRTELFIGGPGGNFPYIHIDYYHLHAWITEIYGRKEFTIFPPSDAPYLYVNENKWQSDIKEPWNPCLKTYPLYAKASPTTIQLNPGETLFIPNGYWHTARSLDVTLSIAFDQLNSQNSIGFLKDVWFFNKRDPRTLPLLAYMSTVNGFHSAKERLKSLMKRRLVD